MYQQITLIGNLGQSPEMAYTPSGIPVTKFSLAVNRRWTTLDGEQHEKVVWFRISAWRKQAESANQYLRKGSKVLIIGEVEEARPYTDRDGNLRASLEVTAHEIRFLDAKNANASDGDGSASSPSGGGAGARVVRHDLATGEVAPIRDEDIPF